MRAIPACRAGDSENSKSRHAAAKVAFVEFAAEYRLICGLQLAQGEFLWQQIEPDGGVVEFRSHPEEGVFEYQRIARTQTVQS